MSSENQNLLPSPEQLEPAGELHVVMAAQRLKVIGAVAVVMGAIPEDV